MIEKLDYYDVLGIVVPGTLLVCWVPVCFPQVVPVVQTLPFPETFAVIALVALAFFVGQVVQAIASLAQPLLDKTWGGRPSDRALSEGLGSYLSKTSAVRIRARLVAAAGGDTDDHSLFLMAVQQSEAAGAGRAGRFNCIYAYHRALVVLMAVAVACTGVSLRYGAASQWTDSTVIGVFLVLAALLGIAWFRTRQRGLYYVREVLLTAESVLAPPSNR